MIIPPQRHGVNSGYDFLRLQHKSPAAKATLLLPRGKRHNQPISVLICLSAFFSSRETCACEIPTSAEISVCVFPS